MSATGGAAAGLFGFRADEEDRRTLGVAACPAPRSQWWFTGAGAGLDHSSTLVLANVDPGSGGPRPHRARSRRGGATPSAPTASPWPPHAVRRVDLADIAPQTDDLALERAHQPRPRRRRGGRPFGAKAVRAPGPGVARRHRPAQPHAPARRRCPPTARSARLLVANPSDLEAIVDVRVAGQSGTFTPTGLDPITVSPGTIEQRRPHRACCPRRSRSRCGCARGCPVVASVRVTAGDHAYATPCAARGSPAAAPLPRGADATVQLTAGAVGPGRRHGVRREGRAGRRHDAGLDATATRGLVAGEGGAYVVVTPSTRRRDGRDGARRGHLHAAAGSPPCR